jgi:hypothetical protein
MAAPHYRYKADSLSWTPTGGSATPITGVQSIKYGEGGEVTDLMSNASELVEEMPLHGIKGRINVTVLDQAGASALELGSGALTFDLEQVKTGRSAVSGADKTVSFGNAVLKDKDADVGSAPGGSATLAFDAADDGTGVIYSIADAA